MNLSETLVQAKEKNCSLRRTIWSEDMFCNKGPHNVLMFGKGCVGEEPNFYTVWLTLDLLTATDWELYLGHEFNWE
jgi:hypothetical protein